MDYWQDKRVKLLGQGGFGTVYLVTDQKGKKVALKQFESEKDAQQEIDLLQDLKNQGVTKSCGLVEYYSSAWIPDRETGELKLSIEMEYVEGSDLFDLFSRRKFDQDEVLVIAQDLLTTLECLHQRGIIHNDVKMENIMWAGNRARLIDYGSSCSLKASRMTSCSDDSGTHTLVYKAPELFSNDEPSKASDIWATGVVLYELLSGRPSQVKTQESAVELAEQAQSSLPLIKSMLTVDPRKRPSAGELKDFM